MFRFSEVYPVSLTSFMFSYVTDTQQYKLSVSNTSGTDLAYLIGNFDLTSNFTLMIDYYNDSPYKNYATTDDKYAYMFYSSSNNYPQVMIKVKLDFFGDMNYSGTNQTDFWYIGPICIEFCNASYSDEFMPIVKPMNLIPLLITETFFNNKALNFIIQINDEYLVINYQLGTGSYNIILFDPLTLIYSNSYIIKLQYDNIHSVSFGIKW